MWSNGGLKKDESREPLQRKDSRLPCGSARSHFHFEIGSAFNALEFHLAYSDADFWSLNNIEFTLIRLQTNSLGANAAEGVFLLSENKKDTIPKTTGRRYWFRFP